MGVVCLSVETLYTTLRKLKAGKEMASALCDSNIRVLMVREVRLLAIATRDHRLDPPFRWSA